MKKRVQLLSTLSCVFLIAALTLPTAQASDGWGGSDGDDKTDTGSESVPSTGTVSAQYDTKKQSCQVYGNATGMGYSCLSPSTGDAKSLRERFGGQKLQKCRYSDVPAALEPSDSQKELHRQDSGSFMLMSCLNNVDFDTYSGGRDMTIDVSVVWVPQGTDTADRHNEVSDFLWRQSTAGAQFPIPFLQMQPISRPVVGSPTFFTFKWLDPVHKTVAADGPYAAQPNGGPFKQIESGGMHMEARASSIRIDPNQKDMVPIMCTPDTPYVPGKSAANQPDDACAITFERSSATAEKFATEKIPSNVHDKFRLTIEVDWQIEYGSAGTSLQTLGSAFTMRIHQLLPVQEVQALNQPPYAIY